MWRLHVLAAQLTKTNRPDTAESPPQPSRSRCSPAARQCPLVSSSCGAGASAGPDAVALHNGLSMPLVEFGIAEDCETLEVALSAGYRLLDTARIYRGGEHERDIGTVLSSGRWKRSEVFVTTKTSSTGPLENAYSTPATPQHMP